MKKTLLIFMLSLFSCISGRTTSKMIKSEALLHYSKGPCLGNRCPVYDLWVFPDGSYYYKSMKGIPKGREKSGMLEKTEMTQLKTLLNSGWGYSKPFKPIRDMPVTVLSYNGETHRYHALKVRGKLREVNQKLEDFVQALN